jgi:nucleotide-binding universal stress UspA family protein
MTIKSILCLFGGEKDELNALNTAFTLATMYGAQLRVLHISPDPKVYVGVYGEGMVEGYIEKETQEQLGKAKGFVTSLAAKHHVPLDTPDAPTHHASARFLHMVGMTDAVIAREGCLSDLIIVGRERNPSRDLLTPALFDTSRPVLFMPAAQELSTVWHDKTVALAWNGSPQAARALHHAIPLLGRVEKLYILVSHGYREELDLTEKSELLAYVQAHGIHAQAIVVAAGGRSHGEALLSRATELRADFLVMGAYSRSVFREMILGGVTEHMLNHAPMPLLLSH